MYVRATQPNNFGIGPFSLCCPNCGHLGTFEKAGADDVLFTESGKGQTVVGLRACPNTACRAAIFFVSDAHGGIKRVYPSQRIDFDAKNIPSVLIVSLTQAITCYAEECYIASAIMIRRCLEELCEDRGATGKDLKDRIGALSTKVVLPKELLDAMHELRLLGNDAAHVEAKSYNSIGKPEIQIAIQVTKEILKAVYQLDAMIASLKSLKKSP